MKKINKFIFLTLFSILFGCGLMILNACDEPIEEPSITVRFFSNEERVATKIMRYNEKIKLPDVDCDNGYYYEGWYFDKDDWQIEFTRDNLNDQIMNGVTQVDVYAKISPITYTITYEDYQDANIANFPKNYTIESETFSIPDISIDYYDFEGWYLNDQKVNEITLGSYGNIVLKAKFKAIDYKINYEMVNGATNPNPASYSIDSGEIVLQDISKEGYNFEGWYQGNDKISTIPAKSHGEITLTAKWSLIQYTISYENTLSADISNFPKTFNIESEDITLPTNISIICHEFIGWTENDKTITIIPKGTAHNVTVVANYNLNHHVIVDLGYPATCTTPGLSNGSHCDVCNEVLTTQDNIPAMGHDYVATWKWDEDYSKATATLVCNNDSRHTQTINGVIEQVKVNSTCAQRGTITYTASVIFEQNTYTDIKIVDLEIVPHHFVSNVDDKVNHQCDMCKQLFPHDDNNYDGTCDSCSLFIEEIKEINNKNQLIEINNNLSGAYVLKANITLDGEWAGIGNKDKAFTGKLYGNNHSISGLTILSTDHALIVNNKGLIDGLTIENLRIDLQSEGNNVGAGIACYNSGTIKNCKIVGTTTVSTHQGWQIDSCKDNGMHKIATFIIGAICAENNKGNIIGCKVEGTINNTFTDRCISFHNGFPLLKQSVKVTSNIHYGNVAAKNNGTISDTIVDCDHNIVASASAEQGYPVDGSYATINLCAGSLVGENTSLIKNSSAKAYKIDISEKSSSGESNCVAKVVVSKASSYEGIMGANTGMTDGFTTIE